MKKLFKKFWLPAAVVLVGAMAGFLYWKYVGCSTGTCAITSKPFNSAIYFAILGALLSSMLQRKQKEAQ